MCWGLAPHGTVREYRLDGARAEPVCDGVPARHAEMVEDIATAVEAFCADYCPEPEIYADQRAAQGLLDALIEAWFAHPCEGALALLGEVKAATD